MDRVESYEPGYLIFSNGQIERLAREDPRPKFPDAEFRDWGDWTIVPGFVDAHVHLAQFGILGAGQGDLLSWLHKYTYPEEAKFVDVDYAARVCEQFFNALIANGTTTAAIYCSIHERATDVAFQTAQKTGMRAFIGKVMMDRNSPPALQEETDHSIAASIRLYDRWDGADGGRLRYVFTPRYAPACSMELMHEVGRIALDRQAYVQSHLSENKEEVAWVRSLFPGAASYAHVYDAAGLLHERAIMAHCIQLSAGEIELLARTGTKVAFCPYSHRNLGSGTMPFRRLQDAGLQIGLGTDIAGGPSISMLDQMREAEPIVGHSAALFLATMGSASILGLEDRIGNFAEGKDADFVVLNGNRVEAVYVCGRPLYTHPL
jgi:guanine deaminase